MVRIQAVDGFGEDAGNCGLAHAARTGKQISMAEFVLLDRFAQHVCDAILARNVGETRRPVSAAQIAHTRHTIQPTPSRVKDTKNQAPEPDCFFEYGINRDE